MARDEPDHVKRAKLDALQLSDEEWESVKLFLSLLKVCSVCYILYPLTFDESFVSQIPVY